MANLLHKAEQAGVLDVFLVKVTHQEFLEVMNGRYGIPKDGLHVEVKNDETFVHDWTRLDDSKPGWEQEQLHWTHCGGSDCILQVASSFVCSVSSFSGMYFMI